MIEPKEELYRVKFGHYSNTVTGTVVNKEEEYGREIYLETNKEDIICTWNDIQLLKEHRFQIDSVEKIGVSLNLDSLNHTNSAKTVRLREMTEDEFYERAEEVFQKEKEKEQKGDYLIDPKNPKITLTDVSIDGFYKTTEEDKEKALQRFQINNPDVVPTKTWDPYSTGNSPDYKVTVTC